MNTEIPIEIVRWLQETFIAIERIPIGPGDRKYKSKLDALQQVNRLQDAIIAHFKSERERA